MPDALIKPESPSGRGSSGFFLASTRGRGNPTKSKARSRQRGSRSTAKESHLLTTYDSRPGHARDTGRKPGGRIAMEGSLESSPSSLFRELRTATKRKPHFSLPPHPLQYSPTADPIQKKKNQRLALACNDPRIASLLGPRHIGQHEEIPTH